MFSDIHVGAVLYTRDSPSRDVLTHFARELLADGIRVGGLVQEIHRHEQGYKARVDIIDVATGDRTILNQPTKDQRQSKTCSIDLSALSESSAVLRQAIADKVELLVVEKFGEQEQNGSGLLHEILTAMAEGIPTLILVPEAMTAQWDEISGGCSTHLPCDLNALRQWWHSFSNEES